MVLHQGKSRAKRINGSYYRFCIVGGIEAAFLRPSDFLKSHFSRRVFMTSDFDALRAIQPARRFQYGMTPTRGAAK